MRDNERGALVALDIAIASTTGSRVTLHLTRAMQLREALAAPAEGDGAVGEVLDMKYNVALFYPRGERPYLQPGTKLYTRPAATAVVPAFDFDRARTLIGYVTGYCNATTLKTLSSDACVALCDLAAMLAAAPAAPKGGRDESKELLDAKVIDSLIVANEEWQAVAAKLAACLSDAIAGECPIPLFHASSAALQGYAALATGEQP